MNHNFKQSIAILFLSILLTSCSIYESNPEILSKAYNFKPEPDKAVIYAIRDFPIEKPLHTRVMLVEKHNPDSRDKLADAMNAIDGDNTTGADIPYNFYTFFKDSFARFETVPSVYEMYSFFLFADQTEIIQSRYTEEFKANKVYFFKVAPKNDGPYNSTIYYLKEITQKEADTIIKSKNLKMIGFDKSY